MEDKLKVGEDLEEGVKNKKVEKKNLCAHKGDVYVEVWRWSLEE